VVVVPQGDTDSVERILRDRGSDIAGVLIDLMPNRAGLRRPPPGTSRNCADSRPGTVPC
jgi:glutamate-1-semialdehyde 2,1-aminomutase